MAGKKPQTRTEILAWLGELQTQLSIAIAKLRGLFKRETDLDDKQRRFKTLSECQACLTKVKQMIAELENQSISLQPPGADLIKRTEDLADALEQELFKERKFAAHLKLFTDITKTLALMI